MKLSDHDTSQEPHGVTLQDGWFTFGGDEAPIWRVLALIHNKLHWYIKHGVLLLEFMLLWLHTLKVQNSADNERPRCQKATAAGRQSCSRATPQRAPDVIV